MQTRPLVSVVIPSFNCARFVGDAIRSVLQQTYEPTEIIIIDDGSTDDTQDVLAEFGSRIRVHYQPNRGLPAARNAGVRLAVSEYVAFLDADDEWVPTKLELQMPVLLASPEAALVHSAATIWITETDERFSESLCSAAAQSRCDHRLFLRNELNSSTVIVRKSAFDSVGGFDESLRSCEDWDLWLRLARRFEFAHVPEHLAIYRIHSRSMARNALRMTESRFVVLDKALSTDPTLWTRLGAGVVRKHMGYAAFSAARQNVDKGNFARARSFLRQGLRYTPLDVSMLALWTSTWLPPGQRQRLANAKRRLFSLYSVGRVSPRSS